MISRIRENFAQFVEKCKYEKEEILKQNKFISLENLLFLFMRKIKITFGQERKFTLVTLNKYLPNINLKLNFN